MGRVELLHKDLTYVLRGIFFTVHNYLGPYRSENQYCDAIERGLQVKNIAYVREYLLPQQFVGERKGRNRVDFCINNTVLVEVKVVPRLSKNVYHQCMRYLVNSRMDLLLLVNFYPDSLFIKRILNPDNSR